MATRSIASLTVSFGLVSIPVKLYSATQAAGGISFNLLHKTCGSRLRQQYICIKEDVVVPREEMAKGFEFAKDQYVMFEPDELKALEEAVTHAVEIVEFVPADAIDPVYYDRAYYLAPDKGGAKPYALFTEALRQAGRTALGRWATRGKMYIVQLRPVEKGLVMQQLLYDAEVRDIGDLEDGDSPEDAYDRRRERGVWNDIPTHRFSTNFTYQLPFGKGKSLLAHAPAAVNVAVSGWQLGGVYIWSTGNFLTPTWTGPDPTGTRFTANRTPANVTLRPDQLRNGNLASPTINRWFDLGAFAAPQPGRFGTAARGVIVGPGSNVAHFNLGKVTPLGERWKLPERLGQSEVEKIDETNDETNGE